jgi:ferredoxin
MTKNEMITIVKSNIRQESKESIKTAVINYRNCIGCGRCVEICEYRAIPQSFIGYIAISAKIDEKLCTVCGDCINICEYDAINLS